MTAREMAMLYEHGVPKCEVPKCSCCPALEQVILAAQGAERHEAYEAGCSSMLARTEVEASRVARLADALDRVRAALGDRLLGQGPLSKEYAHAVMRQINDALRAAGRLP